MDYFSSDSDSDTEPRFLVDHDYREQQYMNYRNYKVRKTQVAKNMGGDLQVYLYPCEDCGFFSKDYSEIQQHLAICNFRGYVVKLGRNPVSRDNSLNVKCLQLSFIKVTKEDVENPGDVFMRSPAYSDVQDNEEAENGASTSYQSKDNTKFHDSNHQADSSDVEIFNSERNSREISEENPNSEDSDSLFDDDDVYDNGETKKITSYENDEDRTTPEDNTVTTASINNNQSDSSNDDSNERNTRATSNESNDDNTTSDSSKEDDINNDNIENDHQTDTSNDDIYYDEGNYRVSSDESDDSSMTCDSNKENNKNALNIDNDHDTDSSSYETYDEENNTETSDESNDYSMSYDINEESNMNIPVYSNGRIYTVNDNNSNDLASQNYSNNYPEACTEISNVNAQEITSSNEGDIQTQNVFSPNYDNQNNVSYDENQMHILNNNNQISLSIQFNHILNAIDGYENQFSVPYDEVHTLNDDYQIHNLEDDNQNNIPNVDKEILIPYDENQMINDSPISNDDKQNHIPNTVNEILITNDEHQIRTPNYDNETDVSNDHNQNYIPNTVIEILIENDENRIIVLDDDNRINTPNEDSENHIPNTENGIPTPYDGNQMSISNDENQVNIPNHEKQIDRTYDENQVHIPNPISQIHIPSNENQFNMPNDINQNDSPNYYHQMDVPNDENSNYIANYPNNYDPETQSGIFYDEQNDQVINIVNGDLRIISMTDILNDIRNLSPEGYNNICCQIMNSYNNEGTGSGIKNCEQIIGSDDLPEEKLKVMIKCECIFDNDYLNMNNSEQQSIEVANINRPLEQNEGFENSNLNDHPIQFNGDLDAFTPFTFDSTEEFFNEIDLYLCKESLNSDKHDMEENCDESNDNVNTLPDINFINIKTKNEFEANKEGNVENQTPVACSIFNDNNYETATNINVQQSNVQCKETIFPDTTSCEAAQMNEMFSLSNNSNVNDTSICYMENEDLLDIEKVEPNACTYTESIPNDMPLPLDPTENENVKTTNYDEPTEVKKNVNWKDMLIGLGETSPQGSRSQSDENYMSQCEENCVNESEYNSLSQRGQENIDQDNINESQQNILSESIQTAWSDHVEYVEEEQELQPSEEEQSEYECDLCQLATDSWQSWRHHKCPYYLRANKNASCNFGAKKWRHSKRHGSKPGNAAFVCCECDYETTTRSKLISHMIKEH